MRRIFTLLMAAMLGVAVAWPVRHFFFDRPEPYPVAPAPVDFHEGTMKVQFGNSSPVQQVTPVSAAIEEPSAIAKDQRDRLHVQGYVVRGRRFNLALSDGTTLTERDGRVSRIERNGVAMKDGTWLPLLAPVSSSVPAAAKPSAVSAGAAPDIPVTVR